MTTKKKTVDQTFDDNSEACRAHGVRPKGSRPPPAKAGKVTVVHKRKGLGLALMDKAQLMYIAIAGAAGMYEIYASIADPTWQAHAMWAFGIATAVAALPCFLRKRE